jgi:tRNA modification GTPase
LPRPEIPVANVDRAMFLITDDTICAIASAPSGAARGIVRISGPTAVEIAAKLLDGDSGVKLENIARPTALPCSVWAEVAGCRRRFDCDLFLWPGSRSYTREPVVELHTVGSLPILEALVNAICHTGARLAEPGEFTLRAFLAGRLDLTQAEAVLGVIDAQAESQLSAALSQLAGGLARPLHQLREDLLQLLAELEAGLDFVEEDIEFVSSPEILSQLRAANELLESIDARLAGRHTSSYMPQIALVGPPNAGKSSLFNALVRRYGVNRSGSQAENYSALVSPERGTTRDYLISRVLLNRLECELIDTAGVETSTEHNRESQSAIARSAEAVACERRKTAAIRAYCLESTAVRKTGDVSKVDPPNDCDLLVLTKSDLESSLSNEIVFRSNIPTVVTSSRTEAGLDQLSDTFQQLLAKREEQNVSNVVATTADRCRESVRSARQSVQSATKIIGSNGGNEIVASELRAALADLGRVVGAVYTDDLLDRIFSKFCIGK